MTWRLRVDSGAIYLVAIPLALLITLLFGSVLRGQDRIIFAGAIGAFLAGLAIGIALMVDGMVSETLVTSSTLGIPFVIAIGCGSFGAVFGTVRLDRRKHQATRGDG